MSINSGFVPCEVPSTLPRVTTNWPVLKHAISSTSVSVSFRVHVRTQVSSWRTRQAEKEKKMVQEGLQSKETLGPKLQAPALFGGLYFCLGIFNKNVYQRSTYLFH